MKYTSIQSNQGIFSVSRMCEIMGVSPSAYYDWLKRPVSARSLEDRRLGEKVKKFRAKSRETYGARLIRQDLVEDDELISRTRVGRLMKQQGLESKVKRKFKATTNSNHGRPCGSEPVGSGVPGRSARYCVCGRYHLNSHR